MKHKTQVLEMPLLIAIVDTYVVKVKGIEFA
jgi:hypothetical protein